MVKQYPHHYNIILFFMYWIVQTSMEIYVTWSLEGYFHAEVNTNNWVMHQVE
jgi:hypothetical protein